MSIENISMCSDSLVRVACLFSQLWQLAERIHDIPLLASVRHDQSLQWRHDENPFLPLLRFFNLGWAVSGGAIRSALCAVLVWRGKDCSLVAKTSHW